MHYTFILKNDKTKNYRLISQLLVLFNLIGFVFLLISNEERLAKNLWLLFSIMVTVVYLFFAVIEIVLKKSASDFWHRAVFGYCSLAWLKEGYWWLSILLALFILFDVFAHRKLIVSITDKNITLPSLPQKKLEWAELNNLILKDELLTIDLKNNKLFQHLISNEDQAIDEKEFNDFCKSKLTIDY